MVCPRIAGARTPLVGIERPVARRSCPFGWVRAGPGPTYRGSVRHGLLIASTLALLVGAGLVAAPASAGDDHWVAVRAIDDRFEVVGQGLLGAAGRPAHGEGRCLRRPRPGPGSASVTTADDTLGASWCATRARCTASSPRLDGGRRRPGERPVARRPQRDTLLSDPVHLEREQWARSPSTTRCCTAPTAGEARSTSTSPRSAGGDHWTAGLLTGSCLNTGEVWLDGIGTRRAPSTTSSPGPGSPSG